MLKTRRSHLPYDQNGNCANRPQRHKHFGTDERACRDRFERGTKITKSAAARNNRRQVVQENAPLPINQDAGRARLLTTECNDQFVANTKPVAVLDSAAAQDIGVDKGIENVVSELHEHLLRTQTIVALELRKIGHEPENALSILADYSLTKLGDQEQLRRAESRPRPGLLTTVDAPSRSLPYLVENVSGRCPEESLKPAFFLDSSEALNEAAEAFGAEALRS